MSKAMPRGRNTLLFLTLGLGVGGCGESTTDRLRDSKSSDGSGESTTPNDQGSKSVELREFPILGQRKFDVLFVVDNSASMGVKQGKLAKGISAFVDVFQDPKLGADVRIGVTGSDVNSLHQARGCVNNSDGELLYSSCLDRPKTFEAPGGGISRYNSACTSVCKLNSAALQTKESAQPKDPTLRRRAWIEFSNGVTNLEDPKVKVADALGCLLPTGISGCGYESQLDSMRLSILKDAPKKDSKRVSTSLGFLRHDASLAVIHVTDELDCSLNSDRESFDGKFYQAVFGKESKTFWVPGQKRPASSICLRAGTECSKDVNGVFGSCEARDWGLQREGLTPELAQQKSVLRPIAAYAKELEALRSQKQQSNPQAQVFVGMIGGVKVDSLDIEYRSGVAGTELERKNYVHIGMGFGCEAPMQVLDEKDPQEPSRVIPAHVEQSFGVAPIRMRALMEKVNPAVRGPVYGSVCAADWSAQLAGLARTITGGGVESVCAPFYVADRDLAKPGLQPNCKVLEVAPGHADKEIPLCQKVDAGFIRSPKTGAFLPPQGSTLCYAPAIDKDGAQTPDPSDNLSKGCAKRSNLELRVFRAPGHPSIPNARLAARCQAKA